MFASGLVGNLLSAFRFPLAPVVLGVILVPLADENLRRALLVFEGKPLTHVLQQWVGTVLVVVIIVVLVEGLLRLRRGTPNMRS